MVFLAAAVAAIAVVPGPGAAGAAEPGLVLRKSFDGPDGLITNSFATWTKDPLAARSAAWWLDGGSLYRHRNAAWTGVPGCGQPDLLSQLTNGSDKLRVHLSDPVPANIRVAFALRVQRFTGGCAGSPAEHWNGVSIYLRRIDGDNFYTAGVGARDGKAYIEKKIGGRYHLLAHERGHRPRFFKWESVGGTVRTNRDGSVTVEVIRGGRVVLRARDRGRGGAPIRTAALTGFRSDNTQFMLDDFSVYRLSR
jgi:hypothetical protein